MGYILRRNCLLKHIMEGKIQVMIEVMGRWGRRHKQLMDDLKETRGTGSWKRKHKIVLCGELALEQACTYHNTDYGTMNKWMNEWKNEWMKFSQQLLISWWLSFGECCSKMSEHPPTTWHRNPQADLELFTSSDGPASNMKQAIINTQEAFYRQLLLFPTPAVHVHP